MKVRKHAKKITELDDHMLEEGEMNSREIYHWMNARIRYGVTMPWVTNMLAKCGLFESKGMDQVGGFSGNYTVMVWDTRRRSH